MTQGAIDRATRWVFIAVKHRKTAAAAKAFVKALSAAAPFRIRTILTDNGKEFTDRLFGSRSRSESGQHDFDTLCQALDIDHRLIKPRQPQTNGMVERFNGHLEQVLRSHRFDGAQDLQATLHRYVWLYNEHPPQKGLDHQTPLQALKGWQQSHPLLFAKGVRNHPGLDNYPSGSAQGNQRSRSRMRCPNRKRGPSAADGMHRRGCAGEVFRAAQKALDRPLEEIALMPRPEVPSAAWINPPTPPKGVADLTNRPCTLNP